MAGVTVRGLRKKQNVVVQKFQGGVGENGTRGRPRCPLQSTPDEPQNTDLTGFYINLILIIIKCNVHYNTGNLFLTF